MALPTEEDLREARGAAVDAKLSADRLQARADVARKNANALQKHYDDLLAEFQGQLAFDTEEP